MPQVRIRIRIHIRARGQVALAMEEWDLHRRIALKFILYLGEKPRVILGGAARPHLLGPSSRDTDFQK